MQNFLSLCETRRLLGSLGVKLKCSFFISFTSNTGVQKMFNRPIYVGKNLIGKRLKQTWAKWKGERVNRMAAICALRYSDIWNNYWKYAK